MLWETGSVHANQIMNYELDLKNLTSKRCRNLSSQLFQQPMEKQTIGACGWPHYSLAVQDFSPHLRLPHTFLRLSAGRLLLMPHVLAISSGSDADTCSKEVGEMLNGGESSARCNGLK